MPQTTYTVYIIRTDVFQKYNTEVSVCNVDREDLTYTTFEKTLYWAAAQ